MSDFDPRRTVQILGPVICWMGVIFAASTDVGSAAHTSFVLEPVVRWLRPETSQEQFDFVHFIVRKTAHFTEYAVLGLLLFRAVRLSAWSGFGRGVLRASGWAIVIAAGYAATDEYHQTFVAGRTPAVHDVMIDTFGACVAIAFAAAAVRDDESKVAKIDAGA